MAHVTETNNNLNDLEGSILIHMYTKINYSIISITFTVMYFINYLPH